MLVRKLALGYNINVWLGEDLKNRGKGLVKEKGRGGRRTRYYIRMMGGCLLLRNCKKPAF